MKISMFISLILLLSTSSSIAKKNNSADMQILAIKAQETIIIDGVLSEDIWNRPGFKGMVQQDPNQGNDPTQKSELWVSYDDEAVYFAAKFYDSNPDSIMARLVRRDFVWGDPSDGCVFILTPIVINATDIFSMFLQQVPSQTVYCRMIPKTQICPGMPYGKVFQ